MSDGWENAFGDRLGEIGRIKLDGVRETDEELRKRLLYVAGDTDYAKERIHRASGARLDELAAEVGLMRRTRK